MMLLVMNAAMLPAEMMTNLLEIRASDVRSVNQDGVQVHGGNYRQRPSFTDMFAGEKTVSLIFNQSFNTSLSDEILTFDVNLEFRTAEFSLNIPNFLFEYKNINRLLMSIFRFQN